MSTKRKAKNVERRDAMVEAFGPRDKWKCEIPSRPLLADLMGACYGAVNGHEIVKRSQGGSITDPANMVLLCNKHNDWCEIYPSLAKDFGLVRSAWEVES